jgi:hypothetical protein
MFSAVSNLSPVSIHTFMPAFLKSSIASGTPSYSLSSNAVAPSRNISDSSSCYRLSKSAFGSAAPLAAPLIPASTFEAPSFIDSSFALSYLCCHSLKYYSSSTLMPKHRVLKPLVENLIRSSLVASKKCCSSC